MSKSKAGAIKTGRYMSFEDRRKAAEKPYYDVKLAQDIVKLLGPAFEHAYDPAKKHFVETDFPLNLEGLYREKGTGDATKIYPYAQTEYGEVLNSIITTKADHIYNFGPEPSATTMAHEYRHRAGVVDEGINRLYDAAYATNEEQWDEAVGYWQDWINRGRRENPHSLEKAEKDLTATLEMLKGRLLEMAWDLAPEGQKPKPTETGIMSFIQEVLGAHKVNYKENTILPYEKLRNKGKDK